MKEQQKRKIQQFHPGIEDGTDLRRLPLQMNASVISYLFPKHEVSQGHHQLSPENLISIKDDLGKGAENQNGNLRWHLP